MVTLGQRNHFETLTQSKISILCILQTRIGVSIGKKHFVPKSCIANVNKRPYAENELVTSYKALKNFKKTGGKKSNYLYPISLSRKIKVLKQSPQK